MNFKNYYHESPSPFNKRLLKDYQPIKEQVNKLRDMLNLERLPDHEEDETTIMTMQ